MTYILQAVAIMLEWLRQHKDNPYPNDDEKAMLIKQTGLTINQINYWFTNARRRILPKWAQQCKWGCSPPRIAQTSSFQPGNSYISQCLRLRSKGSNSHCVWQASVVTGSGQGHTSAFRRGEQSGYVRIKCVHCPWQLLVSALYTDIFWYCCYIMMFNVISKPYFCYA